MSDTNSVTQQTGPALSGQPAPTPKKSAFALAEEIEAILKGASNKTTRQALEMIASLHGLRVIPSDRPTTTTVVQQKAQKATPPPAQAIAESKKGGQKVKAATAAWKNTDEYKSLVEAHKLAVADLKQCSSPDETSEKRELLEKLRSVERQIKALKPVQGN
jgi:hypothetical protein